MNPKADKYLNYNSRKIIGISISQVLLITIQICGGLKLLCNFTHLSCGLCNVVYSTFKSLVMQGRE